MGRLSNLLILEVLLSRDIKFILIYKADIIGHQKCLWDALNLFKDKIMVKCLNKNHYITNQLICGL